MALYDLYHWPVDRVSHQALTGLGPVHTIAMHREGAQIW